MPSSKKLPTGLIKPKHSNQHKPNPPDELCLPIIEKYWAWGAQDHYILNKILEKVDKEQYGLGIVRFRQMRMRLGFNTSRKFEGDIHTIRPMMTSLRRDYPKAGIRDTMSLVWHEYKERIPRSLVNDYFKSYEPDLLRERRVNRFKRKIFWAAGVFDVICIDQHDKWKKYGLALHTGVEPVSGQLLWLTVWWTNNNPRVILSYYLDWVKETGYTSLVTQSDPGSENFGVSNGHTALRHWLDPEMAGTLCHRWMRTKKNVKPEISWNQMRRRFTPGFENILEYGVEKGIYNVDNPIEKLVFRYLFIPWLQQELNSFRDRINNFKKRYDKNKILPQGVPNQIVEHPEEYGVLDFRIKVETDAIEDIYKAFASDQQEVFLLVPPDFEEVIQMAYERLERPVINRNNIWDIYVALLHAVQSSIANWAASETAAREEMEERWKTYLDKEEQTEEIPLIEDKHPLLHGPGKPRSDGSYYYGGVNHGAGLDAEQEKEREEREEEYEPVGPMTDFTPRQEEILCVDFSEEEEDNEPTVAWT